jgi:hypothetical protein
MHTTRAKRYKRVITSYLGMDGEGANRTEAKLDAIAKITRANEGNYNPAIIQWRGYICLVWRTPDSIRTGIIAEPEGVRADVCGHSIHGNPQDPYKAFIDIVRRSKAHVAQLGWKPEDQLTVPEILEGDREMIKEHERWARFQLRYRDAIGQGLSDTDAYSFASKDPTRLNLQDRITSAW